MKVLDPVRQGPLALKGKVHPAELITMEGKTLGILSNSWRSFRTMADQFEVLALESYGARSVIKAFHPEDSGPAPDDVFQKLLRADLVVSGLGY